MVKLTLTFILLSMATLTNQQNSNTDTCNGLTYANFVSTMVYANSLDFVSNLIPVDDHRDCFCVNEAESNNYIIACFPCDESYPRCQIHGSCCPGFNVNQSLSGEETNSLCIGLQKQQEYLVVRSCPVDYDNVTARILCEDDLPVSDITKATVTVVTDQNSNVTYFNKYCAECNDAKNITEWEIQISCNTTLFVRSATNEEEYLRLSSTPGSTCTVYQSPPIPDAFRCNNDFYVEEDLTVRSCNISGQERPYGLMIDEGCRTGPSSLKQRVILGTMTFRNIFCLMCNRHIAWKIITNFPNFEKGLRPPLSFLFGFGGRNKNDEFDPNVDVNGNGNSSNCQSDEWMDVQGQCRKVVCTEGKALRMNRCETVMDDVIRGLPYRLSLLLSPGTRFPMFSNNTEAVPIEDMAVLMQTMISDLLSDTYEELDVFVGLVHCRRHENVTSDYNGDVDIIRDNTPSGRFLLPRFVWMNIFLIAYKEESRDVIEKNITSFFNGSTINISFYQPYNTPYNMYFTNEASQDFNQVCKKVSCNDCHTSVRNYQRSPTWPNAPENEGVPRSDFIAVGPYLSCPFIELTQDEVQETIELTPVPHATKIVLRFGDFALDLKEPLELNQVSRGKNGTFFVCRDFLNSRIPRRIRYPEVSSLINDIQHLLTIACMSASIVCLLITVVTYCLFPDLRCVAGCNTLGLSLSLMIAQIALFVATYMPGRGMLCTVIGIVTHYSWLVTFSWMFICSLHMLRVFTSVQAPTRNNQRKHSQEKTKNLVLSLAVPALIVIIIVVTYTILYDGARIGYGHGACAMDSPYAMNGPLIFVITSNIVFYTFVVCQIWKVRRLQQNISVRKDDRKDFVIYIKLSTLTGMFWMLVLLGEALNNDVIKCLAIVSNGCQGVFLFVSFIVNHRVSRLYKGKFNIPGLPSGTTTSSVTSPSATDETTLK